MKAYAFWSLSGLLLDIVGAFLLGVEAIKVKNLVQLNDRLFRGVQGRSTSPPVVIVEDPVHPTEKESQDLERANRLLAQGGGFFSLTFGPFYWGYHLTMPILYLALAGWAAHSLGLLGSGNLWEIWMQSPWWLKYVAIPITLPIYYVLTIFTVGCWPHRFVRWLATQSIDWLERLESRTASGVIGIAGFLIMLLGFLMQFVGTVIGAMPETP